jgi:hypothetical protein
MGEYRAIRLICKHFNFLGDYIDEELEYGRFWCYLAESLDAEELRDYRDAILQGGKKAKQKWKWATPDHAGTKPVATRDKDVRKTLGDFAMALTGKRPEKAGSIDEYAKVRGMNVVYQDEEGNLYDENYDRIESTSGLIFIPRESQEKAH